MDRDRLEQTIASSPLAGSIDRIMGLARPALTLVRSPCDVGQLPIGASRIGRIVDIDENGEGSGEMAVAQIDCTTLPAIVEGYLPRTGWLVFQWSGESCWGYRPSDRGEFGVFWIPPMETLWRIGPDDWGECGDTDALPGLGELVDNYAGHRVDRITQFEVNWQLPRWGDRLLGLDTRDWRSLLARVHDGQTSGAQMLGHLLDSPQGWGEEHCELVVRGHDLFQSSFSSVELAAAEQTRPNWQLLLQLASNSIEDLGFDAWQDGMIAFFIPRIAIKDESFEQAWLLYQR